MGDRYGPGGGRYERLRRWAEEIGWFDAGYEFSTLQTYRRVAAQWPARNRIPDASFSAHAQLKDHPDRFTLIQPAMTATDAMRAAGKSAQSRGVVTADERIAQTRAALTDPAVARAVMMGSETRHVIDDARPREDRAEQARRALRDPQVARQVVEDPHARSSMARAAKGMEDDAARRQRDRAPRLVQTSDLYEAIGELSRMRRAGIKALDAMRKITLDDDAREELLEHSERVGLVMDWIDSYIQSGDHSFDTELDRLLNEE